MSVDNVMDFDATSVSITPKCGLHNVVLDHIGSRPTLYPESETDEDGGVTEWFVDLSEFGCPEAGKFINNMEQRLPQGGLTEAAIDKFIETDNESWYMAVQLEVR